MAELDSLLSLSEAHPAEVACAQPGDIDLSTAHGRLQARLEAARTAAVYARRAQVSSLYQERSGALRAAWASLGVDQRHAAGGAVIERIVVKRAVRRGPIFDPRRLDITWRA